MKILIFGTTYIDTEAKRDLADKWWQLHNAINPACDLLFVDSNSPLIPSGTVHILQLGDNIGHLSRGGQDGWGRAFCAGLQYAIAHEYDYVVHIEGDSLCRIDVAASCMSMARNNLCAVSVPVRGTKKPEFNWVETGLMFFDVRYVQDRGLIQEYNWHDGVGKKYPETPEWHLHKLIGADLKYGNWRTIRDDIGVITMPEKYDWVSHTTNDVYSAFFAHNTPKVPA